jgi:hypothetical protein
MQFVQTGTRLINLEQVAYIDLAAKKDTVKVGFESLNEEDFENKKDRVEVALTIYLAATEGDFPRENSSQRGEIELKKIRLKNKEAWLFWKHLNQVSSVKVITDESGKEVDETAWLANA